MCLSVWTLLVCVWPVPVHCPVTVTAPVPAPVSYPPLAAVISILHCPSLCLPVLPTTDTNDDVTPLLSGVSVPVVLGRGGCKCVAVLATSLNCSNLPWALLETSLHILVLAGSELTWQCSARFGWLIVLFQHAKDVFIASSGTLTPTNLSAMTAGLNDLNGMTINVASFNCSPFVIFDETGPATGIEWEIVKQLSRVLNFSIKMVELSGDKKWGAVINGSWNGGIALALEQRQADIGVCNIWNTVRYWSVMDFGPPVNEVSFTFIVPRPQLISHRWKSLVNIFSPAVWLCTLAAFMGTAISFWALQNHGQRKMSYLTSLLSMFGILMLCSWEVRPANDQARHLLTSWTVFVLLLTATYSSSISARLALPRFEPRIDSVRQLVNQDLNWFDMNYTSHNKKKIYFNMANHWQREWEKRYMFIPTHKISSALKSRKLALPIQRWGKLLVYFTQDGLDLAEDLKDMRILRETTTQTFVSFGFAKKFPLQHLFQVSLLRMNEVGISQYWSRTVVASHGDRYTTQLQEERDVVDAGAIRPLAWVNVYPAFYILQLGLLISFFVFLLELVKYHRFDGLQR